MTNFKNASALINFTLFVDTLSSYVYDIPSIDFCSIFSRIEYSMICRSLRWGAIPFSAFNFKFKKNVELKNTTGCKNSYIEEMEGELSFNPDHDGLGNELDSNLTIVGSEYFEDEFAVENSNMVSHLDSDNCYNGFLSGKLLENSMLQIGQAHQSDIRATQKMLGIY